MIPLSKEEVNKQVLILEFYEAFDIDELGALIYERLKGEGLQGGRLAKPEVARDLRLTLFYLDSSGAPEKEVVYINVFDVFGKARHKNEIKKVVYDYFNKKFGRDYRDVYLKYENHKRNKNIKEYVAGEELLLQPW